LSNFGIWLKKRYDLQTMGFHWRNHGNYEKIIAFFPAIFGFPWFSLVGLFAFLLVSLIFIGWNFGKTIKDHNLSSGRFVGFHWLDECFSFVSLVFIGWMKRKRS